MTTNQEARHQDLRDQTSTSRSVASDWHAYWDSQSVASGTFNERMLTWINTVLSSSYTNAMEAMHAYAVNYGYARWSDISDLNLTAGVAASQAETLVTGYSSDGDGMALVFETAPSIYVADTGTPANDTDITLATDGLDTFSNFLTYTSPSVKNVRQSDGYIKYAAHNLVTYSNDLTQWVDASVGAGGSIDDFETVTLDTGSTSVESQTYVPTTGATYKLIARVWAESGQSGLGNDVRIVGNLTGQTNPASSSYTLTTTPTEIEVSFTVSTATGVRLRVQNQSGSLIQFKIDNARIIYSPADETHVTTTTAARYALPIQYDTSNVAEGLLVEPAATNLAENAIDPTSGTPTNATISASAQTDPSGGTDAERILGDATNGQHLVGFNRSGDYSSGSGEFTYSVYMRAVGSQQYVALYRSTSRFTNNERAACFDLINGTVVDEETNVTGHIEDAGNGWYRCGFTATRASTAADSNDWFIVLSNTNDLSAGVPSYVGSTSDGVDVAFHQDETGSVPTSLIKTFGSNATRARDEINKATSALPYSTSYGSLYSKSLANTTSLSTGTVVGLQANSNTYDIQLYDNGSKAVGLTKDSAVNQAVFNNATDNAISADTTYRLAMAVEVDNFAMVSDGTGLNVDNSGTPPFNASKLIIGSDDISTALNYNGLIKEIAYYPERLRNEYLEAITAGTTVTLWTGSEAEYWVQNETDALSLDFLDDHWQATTGYYGSAYVLDTGTPANNYDSTPDGLLTYTSPSVKTVMGPSGTLQYAPHNLFKSSDDLTALSQSRCTVSDNGDGSFTLTQNATDFDGSVSQSLTIEAGQSVRYAIEAKAGSWNYVWVRERHYDGTANDTWFNVSTGVAGTTDAAHTTTVTALGDGWYRCEIAFTNQGTQQTGNVQIGLSEDDGNTAAQAGDIGETILFRKPHINYTPADNSYLETTASAARYGLPYDWYTSGTQRGLLVEPAATNLVLASSDANGTGWNQLNISATSDATGMDGVSNSAETLTASGASTVHSIWDAYTLATSSPYVISVYVKAGTSPNLGVYLLDSGAINGVGAKFHLDTEDFGTDETLGTPNITLNNKTITALGNGYYRCDAAFTSDTSATHRMYIYVLDASDARVYTASGETIIFDSIQLETGSVPTSLIKTYGSTATRAIDAITLDQSVTPIPDMATDSDAATFYVEFFAPHTVNSTSDFWGYTESTSNYWRLRHNASNGNLGVSWTTSAGADNSKTLVGDGPGEEVNRITTHRDSTSNQALCNGGTQSATADVDPFGSAATDIHFGRSDAAGNKTVPIYIRRVIGLPRRVSDADQDTWTTTGDLP